MATLIAKSIFVELVKKISSAHTFSNQVHHHLPKRAIQQVTFFDRTQAVWNSTLVDPVYSKQLDLFLNTRSSRHAVLDIRSNRDCRIGCTTHHLQIVKIKFPIRKREKRAAPRAALPWDIWSNNKVLDKIKKEVPNIFEEHGQAVQLP